MWRRSQLKLEISGLDSSLLRLAADARLIAAWAQFPLATALQDSQRDDVEESAIE
jgi:hypothetical protein